MFKARGIPELLRYAVDAMSTSITSATFKKFLEDIEKLCKSYVNTKIEYLEKRSKDEIEVLDYVKSMFLENSERFFKNKNKSQKLLSKSNFYATDAENLFFMNNFEKIMAQKFLDIYNNLNNENIFNQNKEDKEEKEVILISETEFEEIFEKEGNRYKSDLETNKSLKAKQYNVINQPIDQVEITNFKNELFKFCQNEFFKYFYCVILKLFIDNLKKILIDNYTKELHNNENMSRTINRKAEDSLKFVTNKLRDKLLKEINTYFIQKPPEKVNNETKPYSFDF